MCYLLLPGVLSRRTVPFILLSMYTCMCLSTQCPLQRCIMFVGFAWAPGTSVRHNVPEGNWINQRPVTFSRQGVANGTHAIVPLVIALTLNMAKRRGSGVKWGPPFPCQPICEAAQGRRNARGPFRAPVSSVAANSAGVASVFGWIISYHIS